MRGVAIDVIGDEAVRYRINESVANDGLGRKFEGEPDGGSLAGGGTGIDPGRFRQRRLLNIITRHIGGDPAAFPSGGSIKQSQLERAHVAPGGGLAILVPDTDLPENLGTRAEGLACPWDQ